MTMIVPVTHILATKVVRDGYSKYTYSYPNGVPVRIRRSFHCDNCGVEVGGYFGNKVYRFPGSDLCVPCGQAQESISKLCMAMTGMFPADYQKAYGSAWNE